MNVNCPYCHTPNFTDLTPSHNDSFICGNCGKQFYATGISSPITPSISHEKSRSSGCLSTLLFIVAIVFFLAGAVLALTLIIFKVDNNIFWIISAFGALVTGLLFLCGSSIMKKFNL